MINQLHLIKQNEPIKSALQQLDLLGQDGVIFVVSAENRLLGSVTDGDIRRALLKGVSIEEEIETAMNSTPKSLQKKSIDVLRLRDLRKNNFSIIPIVDEENQIIELLNFRLRKSVLPLDVVVMAGGKGERLKPLTDEVPKPLLQINHKPILEYVIKHFDYYGMKNIWVTANYHAEQLNQFINSKNENGYPGIKILNENQFLGTIGSVSLISEFSEQAILVCNADLLTNIDLESFYLDFIESEADLSVISIPYKMDVPYAVMDVKNGMVTHLKEKPTYTYHSNGGYYLMKHSCVDLIPANTVYMATDLINELLKNNKKIRAFEHHGYWLDIGSHSDYKRAQEDAKNKLFEWI